MAVKYLVVTGIGWILVALQWIILSATNLSYVLEAFQQLILSGTPISDEGPAFLLTFALGTVAGLFIGYWSIAILTNTQAALAIEEEATYDTKGAAASRMLVIRGVDDEASLALASASIGSRLGYLVLAGVIPAMVPVLSFATVALLSPGATGIPLFFVFFGTLICAPIFLVLPGVIKSFSFGREFLVNWLVCDIAVDSVPDTSGQVEAITLIPVVPVEPEWTSTMLGLEVKKLPSEAYSLAAIMRRRRSGEVLELKGRRWRLSWQLRHGIYNHAHCVDEIARWLRRVT
jgi:hypothetical protein